MRLFNEKFKELLKLYPNDEGCKKALIFLEQGSPSTSSTWTPEKVKKFINGLRFTVRKRNPYFGHLLDKVPIIVVDPKDKRIQTMAVDKDHNLYINPVFTQQILSGTIESMFDEDTVGANKEEEVEEGSYYTLPEGEKAFLGIIAHELMHIFKDHVARMTERYRRMVNLGGRPVSLWNIATDAEINDELIYKWGYSLIKGGILTSSDGVLEMNGQKFSVRGKTPERIYREIENTLPENEEPTDGDSADPPPPLPPLEPGDIVYDKKTGKYGEIVSIDPSTGAASIAEISREEAKSRV